MRLNKYLALCGVASRRGCDLLIQEGIITVNDKVADIGTIVEPSKDRVEYNGISLSLDIKRYFLFYKPVGVLTTIFDPYRRPCLGDYINSLDIRLFSAGRLDADSEGLLFLTNDGDMAHKIQHPKYKMDKKYFVWVNQELTENQKNRFEIGILLEEGQTAPAKIRQIGKLQYEITLRQGWHRQIRRMLSFLGTEVTRLQRTSIASFHLGELKPGELKEIFL